MKANVEHLFVFYLDRKSSTKLFLSVLLVFPNGCGSHVGSSSRLVQFTWTKVGPWAEVPRVTFYDSLVPFNFVDEFGLV